MSSAPKRPLPGDGNEGRANPSSGGSGGVDDVARRDFPNENDMRPFDTKKVATFPAFILFLENFAGVVWLPRDVFIDEVRLEVDESSGILVATTVPGSVITLAKATDSEYDRRVRDTLNEKFTVNLNMNLDDKDIANRFADDFAKITFFDDDGRQVRFKRNKQKTRRVDIFFNNDSIPREFLAVLFVRKDDLDENDSESQDEERDGFVSDEESVDSDMAEEPLLPTVITNLSLTDIPNPVDLRKLKTWTHAYVWLSDRHRVQPGVWVPNDLMMTRVSPLSYESSKNMSSGFLLNQVYSLIVRGATGARKVLFNSLEAALTVLKVGGDYNTFKVRVANAVSGLQFKRGPKAFSLVSDGFVGDYLLAIGNLHLRYLCLKVRIVEDGEDEDITQPTVPFADLFDERDVVAGESASSEFPLASFDDLSAWNYFVVKISTRFERGPGKLRDDDVYIQRAEVDTNDNIVPVEGANRHVMTLSPVKPPAPVEYIDEDPKFQSPRPIQLSEGKVNERLLMWKIRDAMTLYKVDTTYDWLNEEIKIDGRSVTKAYRQFVLNLDRALEHLRLYAPSQFAQNPTMVTSRIDRKGEYMVFYYTNRLRDASTPPEFLAPTGWTDEEQVELPMRVPNIVKTFSS